MTSLSQLEIIAIILVIIIILFLLFSIFMYAKNKKKKYRDYIVDALVLLAFIIVFVISRNYFFHEEREYSFDYASIPESNGEGYIVLNDNEPFFTKEDESWKEGELSFSSLDRLGRCREAHALLNYDLLPEEERGSIEEVKPSGWQVARYDDLIEDKYLFNRCHLIAFELCGENANNLNLITGTRYMNLNMVLYENQVSLYIHRTANPVLYRVTPVFIDNELVARGVLLEAKSIYDDEIRFCVYFYNEQPGIEINYTNGDSRRK